MSDKKEIVSASPKVRKLAREFGADIYQIQGSQREGRVVEEDVKSFIKDSISGKIEKKQAATLKQYDHSEFGEIDVKPIPRIKKIAGPHLEKSWSEIPHVTQHDEADITEMEKFRKSLRDLYTGEKLSITPLAFDSPTGDASVCISMLSSLADFTTLKNSLIAGSRSLLKIIFLIPFNPNSLPTTCTASPSTLFLGTTMAANHFGSSSYPILKLARRCPHFHLLLHICMFSFLICLASLLV